jgi:hypothetical protein
VLSFMILNDQAEIRIECIDRQRCSATGRTRIAQQKRKMMLPQPLAL